MKNTSIDWDGKDTFIQKEAIVYDYGIFPSPDVFFYSFTTYVKIKNFIYVHLIRKIMTKMYVRLETIILIKTNECLRGNYIGNI